MDIHASGGGVVVGDEHGGGETSPDQVMDPHLLHFGFRCKSHFQSDQGFAFLESEVDQRLLHLVSLIQRKGMLQANLGDGLGLMCGLVERLGDF